MIASKVIFSGHLSDISSSLFSATCNTTVCHHEIILSDSPLNNKIQPEQMELTSIKSRISVTVARMNIIDFSDLMI